MSIPENVTPPAIPLLPAAPSPSGSFPLDFIWKVHDYTNNYIRFADTKAAVMIALATGLLAGLLKIGAHHYCSPYRFNLAAPAWVESWQGFGALVSIVALGLSVTAGVLAVTPRLWNSAPVALLRRMVGGGPAELSAGVIYWRSILLHGTADQFWAVVAGQTQAQVTEALTRHLFVLADIAELKFFWVTVSTWAWFVGAVVACLFILASS